MGLRRESVLALADSSWTSSGYVLSCINFEIKHLTCLLCPFLMCACRHPSFHIFDSTLEFCKSIVALAAGEWSIVIPYIYFTRS
jgi:hypothetical protein